MTNYSWLWLSIYQTIPEMELRIPRAPELVNLQLTLAPAKLISPDPPLAVYVMCTTPITLLFLRFLCTIFIRQAGRQAGSKYKSD